MNTATAKSTTTTNLETVSGDELAAISGGLLPTPNDAGGQWLHTLKTNLINTGIREHNTVSDLQQHHWQSAAKDGAAAVVDDFKTVGDAINPFKIF